MHDGRFGSRDFEFSFGRERAGAGSDIHAPSLLESGMSPHCSLPPSTIYKPRPNQQGQSTAGKHRFRRPVNFEQKAKHMGDKSPKANQKKSSQKTSQASSADKQKQQAIAAKQANTKKK
jgi:hypothetical protein